MSEIIYLVKTNKILSGFKTPVSQITFGTSNLHDRLVRQISNLGHVFKVVDSASLDANCINLYDDTIYSNYALPLALKSSNLETTLNHSIVFDDIERSFHATSTVQERVKQSEIYSVRVNLPEKVYNRKNCRVPFPNFFMQSINSWPDLITVASLIGREKTVNAYQQFQFLGKSLLTSIFDSPLIAKNFNSIGKGCKIHKTAVIESCVIGDGVEIGPYCYLRSSVVGSNTVVQERSSIKLSTVAAGSFIMPCDLFNSYIGANCSIFTSMIHNSFIGDSSFIGGASGFSDSNAERTPINLYQDNQATSSNRYFLGSCVAENCFIGAGLIFQSGLMIPYGTRIVNGAMISKSDFKSEKNYVAASGRVLQIPKDFI